METLFLITVILLGGFIIYLEIVNKENGPKIFYTIYLIVAGTILLAILSILKSLVVYIIFTLFYVILLYGVYTDFQGFVHIIENFLIKTKKVEKTELSKLDKEILDMIKSYYINIMDMLKLAYYKKIDKIIDIFLIGLGFLFIILNIMFYFKLI